MKQCVHRIQRQNPQFQHFLYDDADCEAFIRQNFDSNVLYAYQTLIPGAYKADLWRYCILYIYGGIYLDIKYQCMDHFQLISVVDDEYFVMDRYNVLNQLAVYNAFMVTKPGNKILRKCIDKVVENVQNRSYGSCPLNVTGPTMMIQFLHPTTKKNSNVCNLQVNMVLYFRDNLF